MPFAVSRVGMVRSVGVRSVVRLLLMLVALSAVPAGSLATTFVLMDERDLAAQSLAAVIGTVRSVTSAEAGAIVTDVVIEPSQVVFGSLPSGPVILREPGGSVGGRRERIFGSAEYRVGEHVLVFLRPGPAGTLRTTAMAMGTFRIAAGSAGATTVTRVFDDEVAVLDPASGGRQPAGKVETHDLAAMLGRLQAAHGSAHATSPPSLTRSSGVRRRLPPRPASAFTYLGEPSRWFEPDAGEVVRFFIDPTGDAVLGDDTPFFAAVDALAAWSGVAGSALRLSDGVLGEPLPFAGCDGGNRVVFNDPFGEIDPPTGCSGVVGIGGYCTSDETRRVNDTVFRRIEVGKVTINDGFAACPFWNACNFAELVTHEVGHAIGLGHSHDVDATMALRASFDGRCAALAADDVEGLRFIYPTGAVATSTPTPTATPEEPAAHTPTLTPTRRNTPRDTAPHAVNGRIRYVGSELPVPDVTVDLRGALPQRTSTGASGRFAFNPVAGGSWLIEPNKVEDVGDAISALDAAWVLQAIAGLRTMSPVQQVACDVTGNGSLSALDAVRILDYKLGAIDRLPATALCDSDWLFFPNPAPLAAQDIADPIVRQPPCQRGAVVLRPIASDADDQDFTAAVIGDCTASWESGGARADLRRAAPGTALAMPPLRRRPGGRWLQPIGVHAPDEAHALDLEMRYDAARLQLLRVRAAHLAHPYIVQTRVTQPGRVSISIAAAHPLPDDGRTIVVMEFTSTHRDLSPHLVRPFAVAVDERLVDDE